MIRKFAALSCAPVVALTMAARALAHPAIDVPNLAPPLDPAAAPAWQPAASVKLTWDTTHGRVTTEPSSAWISTDGHALYVRFDVTQHEAVAAAQQTNDVRGTLALTVNDTAQYQPDSRNIQWFESASYTYQLNRDAAFSFGLRRVIGTPPIPNGGGDCIGNCSNISVAYHQRMRHAEIYLAYGDPNALITVPQTIFKVIFYGGAEKGT